MRQPSGERQLGMIRAKCTADVSRRSESSCRGRCAIWPSASAASISSKAVCTRHCSSARYEWPRAVVSRRAGWW